MKPIPRNFLGYAVLLMFSCNFLHNSSRQTPTPPTDPFYTEAFYLGDPRLPLIKPYEVENFSGKEWVANTVIDKRLGGLGPVSRIDVHSSVILIYCSGDVGLYGVAVPEAWFVIQTDKQIEIGFATEDEFKAYLTEQGIDEPEWKDIQTVWETFRDTGELPWEPEIIVP